MRSYVNPKIQPSPYMKRESGAVPFLVNQRGHVILRVAGFEILSHTLSERKMSRLPRLHTEPHTAVYPPALVSTVTTRQKAKATMVTTNPSLKRKSRQSDDEDSAEAADQPRKLPAVGINRPNRPLQPSRTALNSSTSGTGLPKPKTRAQLPTTIAKQPRGTSAPPPAATIRGTVRPTTRSKTGAGRVVSGPARTRALAAEDKRFNDLQTQLEMLESARATDSARLAADMEAERTKVAELQAGHLTLSRELTAAKTQELTQRRELVLASDEIEKMRKAHAKEVMELEMDLRRKEREAREVAEDLRICKGDLDSEREQVAMLKGSVAQQATAQIALTSQSTALQAQVSALQSQIDDYSRTISDLRFRLELSEKEVEALKLETMESEMVRRKLHNMVQELKGNIRVFCRVRPVLSSDVVSSTSTNDVSTLTQEEFKQLKEEVQAHITFPDRRDCKEIVLHSSSESATGQERKEVYSFGFDRVGPSISLRLLVLKPLFRYSNQSRRKQKSLKRFLNLLKAVQTAIMYASSPMARLGQANLSLWKVVR